MLSDYNYIICNDFNIKTEPELQRFNFFMSKIHQLFDEFYFR